MSKKKYKKKLHRATNFAPSAIALNPIDGNIYLLSTVGKTLLVADRSAEIKSIYFLDDAAYIQPEGICFDHRGIMWISNEGNPSSQTKKAPCYCKKLCSETGDDRLLP